MRSGWAWDHGCGLCAWRSHACFPTFAAAPRDEYRKALKVVSEAVQNGVPSVADLHLEGPFLSPKRPSIQNPDLIRPLSQSDVDAQCGASQLLRILLTLAPIEQEPVLLRQLCECGIALFAGHKEASASDMETARSAGMTGVTHLFNTMRQMIPRGPGIVGAMLSSGDYYAGIIADDHHVHLMNWSLAVQTMPDHLWLVSDALQIMNGSSQDMKLYGTRSLYRTGVCWERMAHLVAHT